MVTIKTIISYLLKFVVNIKLNTLKPLLNLSYDISTYYSLIGKSIYVNLIE